MTILQDIQRHRDQIRCAFCMNELIHTIKIHPVKLEDREFKGEDCYGVLCDDCFKAEREPKNAVVFLGEQNDKITYIKTNNRSIFSPKLEKKVNTIEKKLTEEAQTNNEVISTAASIVNELEQDTSTTTTTIKTKEDNNKKEKHKKNK